MSDYRGIPFNGGLDSPTGAGAANIVETLEAIIDYLLGCETPGTLADHGGVGSIDYDARRVISHDGIEAINWDANTATDTNTNTLSIDWRNRELRATDSTRAIAWQPRQLLRADNAIMLQWDTQLIAPSLPTFDPGVTGALWNNGGVVNISP